MKKLVVHNPVFRLLIPPIVGLFAYILILLFYNDLSLFTAFFTGQELYVVIGISYVLLELLRSTTNIFNRFYSFQKFQYYSVVGQVALSLGITWLLVTLAMTTYFTEVMGFSISRMQLTVFNGTFLAFTLLYELFYYGLFFMSIRNETRMKEEVDKNIAVKEAAMRFTNEINPEMLYDSLESLIILSRKNPDEADEFINELSSIYRYVLSNKQSDLVELDDEINMGNKMVSLLNYKHGGAILFKNRLNDLKDIQLIPGTIPKLIERVVESSIVTNSFPLMIQCDIDEESNYIELSYTLNEKLVKRDSNILSEMQRSYSFLTDKPLIHVKAYGQGYIKVPILAMKTV